MANIMVVDDEVGIRELLSEILGDEGHVVHVAEDAQQAREIRQAELPDLVLLDIWMPECDGITLLKEWSAQRVLTMPVIMMSGHATIDTAVEATRYGALDFLEKPITMQKLLGAVQKGLTRAHLNRLAQAPTATSPTRAMGFTSTQPMAAVSINSTQSSLHSSQSAPVASPIDLDLPLREARDEFERMYFEHHLAREHGSMTRVAEKTGLERTHLYRKLKQLGVELVRGTRRNTDSSTAAHASVAPSAPSNGGGLDNPENKLASVFPKI